MHCESGRNAVIFRKSGAAKEGEGGFWWFSGASFAVMIFMGCNCVTELTVVCPMRGAEGKPAPGDDRPVIAAVGFKG